MNAAVEPTVDKNALFVHDLLRILQLRGYDGTAEQLNTDINLVLQKKELTTSTAYGKQFLELLNEAETFGYQGTDVDFLLMGYVVAEAQEWGARLTQEKFLSELSILVGKARKYKVSPIKYLMNEQQVRSPKDLVTKDVLYALRMITIRKTLREAIRAYKGSGSVD